MGEDSVKLRVGEVPPNAQQDVGKGIVRIDSKIMEELGVREGDAVLIEGNRETVGRAARSYPADKGLGIARMDGYTRKNAGTSLGEHVEVEPAELEEADQITLAPAEEGVVMQVSDPNMLKRGLNGRPVIRGDIIVPDAQDRPRGLFDDMFEGMTDNMRFNFSELKLRVVKTKPRGPVKITENTEIKMKEQAVKETEQKVRVPEVTYEDIGGLESEVQKVREMIELPLKHPEVFQQLGIDAPSGVLLQGPPGTGKTLLAKAVANEADANFLSIDGPEIMSKYYGESEKQLREKFEEAREGEPSIIFIDEIDAIAPKRGDAGGEVERRVVATLLSEMDGLESRENVIVIAATNRAEAIDPALRRGGRFDREIEIGVPNREGRKEVLQIHTRNMPLADDVDLDEIADLTHGYVGADLEALCKEAAMSTLRNVLPEIDMDEEIPSEVLEKLVVDEDAMLDGLRNVEPSQMREVMVEVPQVTWEDVGGLNDTKERLQEMVEWPQKYPERFENMGIEVPKGILMYGMPGTGKTLLAKAVANEANANFISIKGPEVFSKYVGESEESVREIFKKARQVAPCVLFIDEIDSIAPRRGGSSGDSQVGDRVVNQLLTELDGIESLKGVTVIAATNRPDMIDPAIMRPGRIDRNIEVEIPDEDARKRIFEVHTEDMPLNDDVDIDKLAEKTENYVGSDIESVCREAGMNALRSDPESEEATMEDFEDALEDVRATATDENREMYRKMAQKMNNIDQEEDDQPDYYA
ncbi:CDC48 family AAA ATPase [Candidatus Nanohalobium constans]|uniref:AAA family ATPase, CDC48 subfamily n=1 Tax=Candidatus Nanohalobium constans TaxID=2565781 RepID=A0A5Q0UEL6_9ARCH|nr:CDC48 family AAA ATPase [Candidatus Nanohalobium constans]QGA79976.1 AAA family ATPase, CDC48 subfamily [Candidatus Nanohalobium constans]